MHHLPRRMTYSERKALDDKAYQESIKHLDNFDKEKKERAAKGELLNPQSISTVMKADNYIKNLSTKLRYEQIYIKPLKRRGKYE